MLFLLCFPLFFHLLFPSLRKTLHLTVSLSLQGRPQSGAQRGEVTCPGPHSLEATEAKLVFRQGCAPGPASSLGGHWMLLKSLPSWSRACMLSHFSLSDSATPWTVAHQAPWSMGFSRQEYWDELQFPPLRDLPNSDVSYIYLDWRAGSFPPGKLNPGVGTQEVPA